MSHCCRVYFTYNWLPLQMTVWTKKEIDWRSNVHYYVRRYGFDFDESWRFGPSSGVAFNSFDPPWLDRDATAYQTAPFHDLKGHHCHSSCTVCDELLKDDATSPLMARGSILLLMRYSVFTYSNVLLYYLNSSLLPYVPQPDFIKQSVILKTCLHIIYSSL